MTTMQENVQQILAELRRRFETLYADRLVHMVLFGSHARGDAEPGSDIDVLVVLEGPVSPCDEIVRTIDDVAAVSLDHGVVLCCVFISHDDYTRRRTPLLLNVQRDGVLV